MNSALIALLVSVSGATWIYTKLQRSTGAANNGPAAKGALVSGVIIFLLVFTLASMLFR